MDQRTKSTEMAYRELAGELMSKVIEYLHTNGADIMRTKAEYDKEKVCKIVLLEIERNMFNAAQKALHAENDTALHVMEIFREVHEKTENFIKEFTSLQHCRDIYNFFISILNQMVISILNQTKKAAEVQQITEIELD